jgi:glycerol-3-phosphate acyltransferase PlsY
MDHPGLVAVLVVVGYLLGAIPFGIVVSKAMGLPFIFRAC